MTLVKDIRNSVIDTTPVLAAVGATDLMVEKVRAARAPQIDVKALQSKVQQVPTLAMTRSIELAGKVEETYGDLAARGEKLVNRIARQKATQDLVAQGKITVSRGKAAVTTVRKAAGDTRAAAKSTLTVARREGSDVVAGTQHTVTARTTGTKAAAKRTATTARKRTATARSTAKSAATSATKTAQATVKAAEAAASKVGD